MPFKEYLQKQKEKLHLKPGTAVPQSASWLSWVFEKLVLIMVVYFVISIINSMAQEYHKKVNSTVTVETPQEVTPQVTKKSKKKKVSQE